MGKSNNSLNKIKKFYENEKNFHFSYKKDKITTLKEYEIEILENINNSFAKEFTDIFFSFTKNNIQLVSCNTRIGSCNIDDKIIKNARYFNLVEILPHKNQSFIIFSYDFLSIIIDILFGGQGSFINENRKIKDITSTENLINKKIIKFMIISLSEIYKKYFSSEINFIHQKTFFDFKNYNFNINTVFAINSFNFNIKNIEVCFNILIPISILKYINKKIVVSLSNDYEIKKNIENTISFNDIYNVELNIISNIIDVSVSYNKLYNLSIGDVLLIEKPNSITGFIEGKPIFFGKYKRFNEQSIVFIEEFINNNLESNQDKDKDALMSNIKKNSDSKKLIDSEKKISKSVETNKNLLFEENSNKSELNNFKNSIDSKHVLLNTCVNITVELGKSKIKIKDFLKFSKGSMLILDKSTQEPLDIFINGYLIASGEIVVLDKKYGLRITKIKNSLKNIKIVS